MTTTTNTSGGSNGGSSNGSSNVTSNGSSNVSQSQGHSNRVSLLVVPLRELTLREARAALFFLYTGMLPPPVTRDGHGPQGVLAPPAFYELRTPRQGSTRPARAYAAAVTPETLARVAVQLQSLEMAHAVMARFGLADGHRLPLTLAPTVAQGLGHLLAAPDTPVGTTPLLAFAAHNDAQGRGIAPNSLVWLRVDGERLPADRTVLCARCSYFAAALRPCWSCSDKSQSSGDGELNSDASSGGVLATVLDMPEGATPAATRRLLEYLAEDAVQLKGVSLEELLDVLVLARFLLLDRYAAGRVGVRHKAGKGAGETRVKRGHRRLLPVLQREKGKKAAAKKMDSVKKMAYLCVCGSVSSINDRPSHFIPFRFCSCSVVVSLHSLSELCEAAMVPLLELRNVVLLLEYADLYGAIRI